MGKPMTRERLEDYQHLIAEVALLEYQISNEEKRVVDSVKGSLTDFPFTEASYHIEGLSEATVKRLRDRKTKASIERDAIEQFIDSIKSSYLRNLITLRYVEGKTWYQAAQECGRCVGQDGARKAVERFLENSAVSDNSDSDVLQS